MAQSWIENGPATKRTLVLCAILGVSAAAHRWTEGLRTASADTGQMAAGPDSAPDTAIPRLPATNGRPAPTEPAKPPAAPDPTRPSAEPVAPPPKLNPYARRLWTIDPFRSPNVLRLAGTESEARPLLDEVKAAEVLARTQVERDETTNGRTRVSITMPGDPDPADAVALVVEPATPVPPPASVRRAEATPPLNPVRPVAAVPAPVKVSVRRLPAMMFAFAGHDLSREESRRWTLASAFDARGY